MRQPRRIFLLFAALVIGALAFFLFPATPTRVTLPVSTNGYDDFLHAGGIVVLQSAPGPGAGPMELRDLVSRNEEALKWVRVGLTKPCQILIQPAPEFYVVTNLIIAVQAKALDLVLEAQGRLAEMEHKTNDALDIYLEALRFSHDCGRGGYKLNALLSLSCQNSALGLLEHLAPGLDATQCRRGVAALSELEASREPVSAALDRDAHWWSLRQTFTEQARYTAELEKNPALNPVAVPAEEFKKRAADAQERAKKLAGSLAARAAELEKAPDKH